MEIKDNFSEVLLLSEQPVIFYFDDYTDVTMHVPTIKEFFNDQRLQYAVSISYMDINELRQYITQLSINNCFELYQLLLIADSKDTVTYNITYLFKHCFGEQCQIVDKHLYLGGHILTEEWFARITEIVHIASCIKKFNEQNKFSAAKPQWLIEQEKKIKRIKSQGADASSSNVANQLLKVLIQINLELGYTFEQLFNMNYYHIQQLQQYIPKIVSYDIQKRALTAGNSKNKKLKYVTD